MPSTGFILREILQPQTDVDYSVFANAKKSGIYPVRPVSGAWGILIVYNTLSSGVLSADSCVQLYINRNVFKARISKSASDFYDFVDLKN